MPSIGTWRRCSSAKLPADLLGAAQALVAVRVVAHDRGVLPVLEQIANRSDTQAVVVPHLVRSELEARPRGDATQRGLPTMKMLQHDHRFEDPLVGAERKERLADHALDEGVTFREAPARNSSQQIAVSVLEMGVEPRLPIEVTMGGAREAGDELRGNEVVVRIGVRCEMSQIAVCECSFLGQASGAQHFPANAPTVAMRVDRARVALDLNDVGGDRPIEIFPTLSEQQLL